jgi:hypothetical protein
VRGNATDKQTGEQIEVLRQFDCKYHCSERRTHGAAHHCGHADESPKAAIADREKWSGDSPERATHHQQRREHSAGRSRPQRYGPNERLADQKAKKRWADNFATQ